jgi:hypothetical protein
MKSLVAVPKIWYAHTGRRTAILIGGLYGCERYWRWIAFAARTQNNLNCTALNDIEFIQTNSGVYVHTSVDIM